jgi:hypothetical protein
MFLRLLSIRTRLIAAFTLLLLLLSTVAAIGSLQIARVQFNANDWAPTGCLPPMCWPRSAPRPTRHAAPGCAT